MSPGINAAFLFSKKRKLNSLGALAQGGGGGGGVSAFQVTGMIEGFWVV